MEKKNKLISAAASRRRENKKYVLEMTLERNRIYLRGLGNNSVSVKMDVTPLWHFFKDMMQYQEDKKAGRITE